MRRTTARMARALTTAAVVAAVILTSVIGLDDWADAATTASPSSTGGHGASAQPDARA